jgi:hypothetical protein
MAFMKTRDTSFLGNETSNLTMQVSVFVKSLVPDSTNTVDLPEVICRKHVFITNVIHSTILKKSNGLRKMLMIERCLKLILLTRCRCQIGMLPSPTPLACTKVFIPKEKQENLIYATRFSRTPKMYSPMLNTLSDLQL